MIFSQKSMNSSTKPVTSVRLVNRHAHHCRAVLPYGIELLSAQGTVDVDHATRFSEVEGRRWFGHGGSLPLPLQRGKR
jgi:hypothetical protein